MDNQKYSRPIAEIAICLPPELGRTIGFSHSIKIVRNGYYIMKVKEWLDDKKNSIPPGIDGASNIEWNATAERLQDDVALGRIASRYGQKEVNPNYYRKIQMGR